jgi:hypothetical protein
MQIIFFGLQQITQTQIFSWSDRVKRICCTTLTREEMEEDNKEQNDF